MGFYHTNTCSLPCLISFLCQCSVLICMYSKLQSGHGVFLSGDLCSVCLSVCLYMCLSVCLLAFLPPSVVCRGIPLSKIVSVKTSVYVWVSVRLKVFVCYRLLLALITTIVTSGGESIIFLARFYFLLKVSVNTSPVLFGCCCSNERWEVRCWHIHLSHSGPCPDHINCGAEGGQEVNIHHFSWTFLLGFWHG